MNKQYSDALYSLSHTKWSYKYHVVFAPKYSLSGFMGFLKGKDNQIIFKKWANVRYSIGIESFGVEDNM